jgi:hypothetical protein
VFAVPAAAQVAPYQSYTYDYWGAMVPTPHAYVPDRAVSGHDIGVGAFKSPQDIFATQNGDIYIVDSGNHRIVQVNQNFELVREIKGFVNNGKNERFNNPRGIHVTDNGTIYIADRDNNRVVILDSEGQLLQLITSPAKDQPDMFAQDFRFRPEKLSVDQYGSLFVISLGVYDGILEFDDKGVFLGFKGAPRVNPSLWDYIWRVIGTRAQRERMALFLPVEHSNLCVDDRGFIYATAVGGQIKDEERVRRLNTAGTDVLLRLEHLKPIGDYFVSPPSYLVDILAREYDIYSVLDRERGRIFTYESSGNLLYVFGGIGDKLGLFHTPVAIAELRGQFLVLDSMKNNVTVFRPTHYQEIIHGAIGAYYEGKFAESAQLWTEVLQANSNYDMAYTGTARAKLMQGKYAEAMADFRLAQDRAGYSEALKYYRKQQIERFFGPLLLAIAVLILYALFATKRASEGSVAEAKAKLAATYTEVRGWEEMENRTLAVNIKRVLRGLQFAFHVIVDPFDGFWDLKHEKRGNVPTAVTLLILGVITYLAMYQYTGFPFNTRNPRWLNVVAEIFSVVAPFMLWCGINWSLTTLMDGKGGFKDIFIASCYSLVPIILIILPLTLISNVMTLDEKAFYWLFATVSIIWSVGLLFVSTMVIHEYSIGAAVAVFFLILVGVVVALFIGFLFADMLLQFIGFFGEVYREFVFRL